MKNAARPLLLVGGLPCEDTESILRSVAPEVGHLVLGLTDGEPGVRRMWVGAIAVRVWSKITSVIWTMLQETSSLRWLLTALLTRHKRRSFAPNTPA